MTTARGTKSCPHGTDTDSPYTSVIHTNKLSGRNPMDIIVDTVVIATESARSALNNEHPEPAVGRVKQRELVIPPELEGA